jgi:hypothetical protein
MLLTDDANLFIIGFRKSVEIATCTVTSEIRLQITEKVNSLIEFNLHNIQPFLVFFPSWDLEIVHCECQVAVGASLHERRVSYACDGGITSTKLPVAFRITTQCPLSSVRNVARLKLSRSLPLWTTGHISCSAQRPFHLMLMRPTRYIVPVGAHVGHTPICDIKILFSIQLLKQRDQVCVVHNVLTNLIDVMIWSCHYDKFMYGRERNLKITNMVASIFLCWI